MNISQSEYTAKYENYLLTVRENKKLRLQRDTYLNTQRFYSFSHFGGVGLPNVTNYSGNHELLYFPVGVKNATVNQATLRLFAVRPLGQSHPTVVTLRVYQVTETSRSPLDSRHLTLHDTSRWAELDVVSAVEAWITGQNRNLGLEVECDECGKKGVRLLTGPSSAFSPVLNVLVTEREAYPRNTRAMGGEPAHYDEKLGSDCRKGPNHGRCCRHNMDVVFKDVPGFEFILQPYKFNAGFCKGKCPPRYHPASQHALLQSLVWQMYRAPRPCCAPHVLADIEVLHLDENDPSALKVSTWKGMQVHRCACT